MQRAADRQKTLARFGALMSDERLPIEVVNPFHMDAVEGRILVHGQDDQSGRSYLMLESAAAKVYFVHYTSEIDEARSRGELRVNSFVQLQSASVSGAAVLDVKDCGNAESLLSNRQYFANSARKLLNRGVMPTEDGWGGWLGRYQAALVRAATEVTRREENKLTRENERKRRRERSLGR